jgi:eukaryotic-like serine/threonine-protein kinase
MTNEVALYRLLYQYNLVGFHNTKKLTWTLVILLPLLLFPIFEASINSNVNADSAAASIPKVTQLWNSTLSWSTVQSPVVADGFVYVESVVSLSSTTSLSCINASTGTQVWSRTDNFGSFTVANGYVYVGATILAGASYKQGVVYCLKASDGAELWSSYVNGYVGGSPVVVGDRVYVGAYTYSLSTDTAIGSIYALNAATGAKIWTYLAPAGTRFDSLVVANGYVYAVSAAYIEKDNSWASAVFAFHASNGQKTWNYTITGYFGSLIVTGGNVYVYRNMDTGRNVGPASILAIGAENGSLIWNYTTSDTVSDFTFANSTVYGVTSFGNVSALDASNGTVIWNYKDYSKLGSVLVANGYLYVSSTVGVSCFNAYTGARIWNYQASDYSPYTDSSPTNSTYADGIIYFGWNGPMFFSPITQHNFYALDAFNGKKLWNYTLANTVMSSPVVANGTVYIGASFVTSESPDYESSGTVLALNSTVTSLSLPTSESFSASTLMIIAIGIVVFAAVLVVVFIVYRKKANKQNINSE